MWRGGEEEEEEERRRNKRGNRGWHTMSKGPR